MSHRYLLIDGTEWGPFDDHELAEIQATARRTYRTVRPSRKLTDKRED